MMIDYTTLSHACALGKLLLRLMSQHYNRQSVEAERLTVKRGAPSIQGHELTLCDGVAYFVNGQGIDIAKLDLPATSKAFRTLAESIGHKGKGHVRLYPAALAHGLAMVERFALGAAICDVVHAESSAERTINANTCRKGAYSTMECLGYSEGQWSKVISFKGADGAECSIPVVVGTGYEYGEILASIADMVDAMAQAMIPDSIPFPSPKAWKVAANAATVEAPVIVHDIKEDAPESNVIPFPRIAVDAIDPTPYATSAVRSVFGHKSLYYPPEGATIVANRAGCREDRFVLVIAPQYNKPGLAWDGDDYEVVETCGLWSQKFGIGDYWDNSRPLMTDEGLDAMRRLAIEKQHADMVQRRQAEEARQAEQADSLARGEALWQSLGLDKAKAFIVAEYREDKSDIMTDYFASSTTKRIILSTSTHNRNLFPEMRKACESWPEVAHMATDGKEHRENYSMGRGTYLGGDYSHATGWNVRKELKQPWNLDDLKRDLARHGGPLVAAAPVVADGGPSLVEPTESPSHVVESTTPPQTPQLAPGVAVVWTKGKRQGQTGTVRTVRADGRLVIDSGDKIHGESHGITADNVSIA